MTRFSEYLEYDESSPSCLVWKQQMSSRALKGSKAGSVDKKRGYFKIALFGKYYLAHRVVWVLLNGEIPSNLVIDHVDGDTGNNLIQNLRLSTISQNGFNSKKTSRKTSSSLKGASFNKASGKWKSYISVNKKQVHLGVFDSELEAHAAYVNAATEVYKDFMRV